MAKLKSTADKEIEESGQDENGKKKRNTLYPHDYRWDEATYLNCDLRYFDLKSLGGNFDCILIDPPW